MMTAASEPKENMSQKKTLKTAMVGWRGMVGSVLMQRMEEEGDFSSIEADFFSTSQAGAPPPMGDRPILDASNLKRLAEYQVILTCQGGSYTEATYQPLRDAGWNGIWIDAASTLRMQDDCVIVLDPVNRAAIHRALSSGVRTFAGGNCTVSLLLMAILPLIERGWVEWVNSMTYQAVSGAGAQAVLEMIEQTRHQVRSLDAAPEHATVMQLAEVANLSLTTPGLAEVQGAPIASSLLPWIDSETGDGRSREEWKGVVESNKILERGGANQPEMIPMDGLCVRVPTFRCHSQAVTIKLTEALPIEQLNRALLGGHRWLEFVANAKQTSIERLTPLAVSGSLTVAVGRVRKLQQADDMVTLFTVGDQLLWGAAEPLRRMLRIAVERSDELEL